MTTDLFAATRGLDARVVAGVVPPWCHRVVEPLPAAAVEGDEAVVELPEWVPRSPARHFVPSLSLLDATPWSVRFELSVHLDGAWTPWVASAPVGPHAFAMPSGEAPCDLSCDVDVFTAPRPAGRARLRARVRADDLGAAVRAPWLVSLSASDLAPPGAGEPGAPARVAVPPLSQMEAPAAIRLRVCSPASVAMVLAALARPADLEAVAADAYHAGLDLYGVWPAAVRAAARRGVAGYLLRFPDWRSAAWCLAAGLPVVASLRYAAGELTGAAIAATSGHLVVLTGHDGGHVHVNDPAAPTRAEVPRRYPLDELRRVWLERSGLGYVFFDPARGGRPAGGVTGG
jgi:hypothetical protein